MRTDTNQNSPLATIANRFTRPTSAGEQLRPIEKRTARAIALFDLDGTLVDSLDFTFQAFNHGIVSQGGSMKSPEEIMRHFGPWEKSIFSALVGEAKADSACEAYEKFVKQNIHLIPTFPEIESVIQFLNRNEVITGIVTGRSAKTTHMILEHHFEKNSGWVETMRTVVCNDHVAKPKPAPDGIHLALDYLKQHLETPSDFFPPPVIYFGDSVVDVEAAKAAGAVAVSCLWDSRANREKLKNKSPHHFISHPREIIPLLQRLLDL